MLWWIRIHPTPRWMRWIRVAKPGGLGQWDFRFLHHACWGIGCRDFNFFTMHAEALSDFSFCHMWPVGSTLLFPARALFVFDIVALLLSLSLSVWIASMPPKNLKRLAPVVVVPKVNEFIFSPCMLRHWLTSSLAICDPLGPTFSFPARPLHVRNLAAFFFSCSLSISV